LVAVLFDKILAQGVRAGQIPARTKSARTWFRDTAKKVTITPSALMKEDRTQLKNRAAIGKMYFFFYDPKHKKTLPYYDRFPLIFKVQNVPGGFHGLNMHYLPLPLRARLMDTLYELASNTKYDEGTKLKLTYQVLQGVSKYYKPTFKMYLNEHVRSRFLEISSTDWDMALFLPLEQFEKASKSSVWKDSKAMAGGR
jgi:hypothetical protein|tara:strand:- start:2729 stop:3319 length:591 start_codon:yes stop_codon:yes gene_type:complete